jgi:hypothetical protein
MTAARDGTGKVLKHRGHTEVHGGKIQGLPNNSCGHNMRPLGLKPELILILYAALKRRSSTVLHAVVVLPL